MSDSDKTADLSVVIGRFQPFHHGHQALVDYALQIAPRALLVIGSAGAARAVKNPFSEQERMTMIRESLTPEQRARVSFAAVRDYYDEVRWAKAVDDAVRRESRGAIALVGFRKDESSSYLSLFPAYREHALPRQAPIDGTQLRRAYFEWDSAELGAELTRAVPARVRSALVDFQRTPEFARLAEELRALDAGRAKYGSGPFVTVDAVITHREQLLLVQRGHAPGRDLWALPGGFLEGAESLLTSAIRELEEETQMAYSHAELRALLAGVKVFDHPQRSQRGRTITHAHYFPLPPEGDTPSVKGSDDAKHARWVPVSELSAMSRELFEDHYHIIDQFLGIARD